MSRSSSTPTCREDEPRASLRFALSYAAICAGAFALYFVFTFPYSGLPYRVFTAYLHFYAVTAGAALHLFDPVVSVSGNDVVGRTSLSIVRGCDGSEVLVLFAAAVLATPSCPWRLRLLGAAGGAALLSLANVVRICCLYYVGIHAPSTMDLWHLEIWPLVLIVLAVTLFVAWRRWASAVDGARGA